MASANRTRTFSKGDWVLLAAITALGFLLRFYNLGGATPWIDEITILSYAAPPKTPASIVKDIYERNLRGFTGQHMPMQYVLANLAIQGAQPTSVDQLAARTRTPFAFFGALTIPIVFVAVRALYGPLAAGWAALLTALSFFHVYQSRDATSYGPLLFFQSLAFWGAIRLFMLDGKLDRRAWGWGAVFFVGMLGMFFTHLISWFFGATLGALALGSLVLRWKSGNSSAAIQSGPTLLIALLAIAALPFLQFPLAAASGAGIVDDVPERVTVGLLAYQFAAFGWGREEGRLTAFSLAWLWGAIVLWRRGGPKTAVAHLAMIAIPTAIFFGVLMRDFFPRYLAVVFLPFVCIAAVGLGDIQERISSRIRMGGPVFAAVVLLVLALWHVEPFRTLYAIRDKLMPFSIARDWIMKNVPEGGLYMWRNGYFLREVPGALPTPGRSAAYADHPNKGIPREEFARRSLVARDTFRRFPEAVLISEPPTDAFYPHQDLWTWTEEFPHVEVFHDPTLSKLWRWGFSPHGYKMDDMAAFKARWRRREEIYAERFASGRPSAWPTGAGWRYLQTREGITLATPAGEECRLAMALQQPGAYSLRVTGTAPASGRLSLWRIHKGQWTRLGEVVVGKSDGYQAVWGPYELEPGDQIALKPLNTQVSFLFIYDFVLVSTN